MREPHAPDHLPPPDWASAFAALPPETPPADALSSVFARIPASTPARSGRHWWIAAAAVLALAAVIPMMNFVRHPGASEPHNAGIASARHTQPSAVKDAGESRNPALAADSGIKKLGPGLRRDDGEGTVTARPNVTTPPVVDALPMHSTPIRVAKADPPRHNKSHRTQKSVPATEPADKAMEPLYAESARLEALLALARDDRVSSATAVALGSDFEARIAGIDAALIQPSLSSQRRLELWRDRVSALRAYASFESTQRALAASGERYDAMLVSID